ncbi:MAG TPA: esterase-like activity of phytase family protein [Verrucomicrobiales bacterium]|nr:esterase-like activity of phytase family protein [Verrucomicrobiales bacterium]
MTRSLFLFLAFANGAFAGVTVSLAAEKAEFVIKDERVVGLSGLAWCREDLYYAASDRLQGFVPVRLTVDGVTGLITAGKVETPVPVKTGFSDFEDIVCDAKGGKVYLSAEGPPGIAGFTLAGKPLPAVKLPPVFLTARPNLSMEALTRDAATGHVWTANEDTLPGDGETASRKAPGVVRLQEFDAGWKPLRQYAWRTETSSLRVSGSGTGVPALCILPDGNLLVLERVFAGFSMEVHISLADFSGATDTSKIAALTGVAYTPAKKVPLFKKNTSLTNYEGMALGPSLKDGSRSLVLVADSGNATDHRFMALKVQTAKR